MKKIILISLLGAFMIGCSATDRRLTDSENGPDSSGGAEATNYLTFHLVSPITRAEISGDYQDGTERENYVKMVRFFFFDDEGIAAPVWKKKGTGGYESFVDWYPTAEDIGEGDKDMTVEKIVNATLGINTPLTMEHPGLVLAVINPNRAVMTLGSTFTNDDDVTVTGPSLEEVRAAVADFYTGQAGATDDDNFVMSNSVFVNDGDIVDVTVLDKENNFFMTIDEAKTNPIIMFVERVLARIDLAIEMTPANTVDGTPIYSVNDDPYQVDGKDEQIYVRLLGWNVTGTPNRSRLVKNVSPEWADNLFGKMYPWNAAVLHRSFWAVNPPAEEFEYQFGTLFGPANSEAGNFCPANAQAIPEAGNTTTAYLHENAAESAEFGGEAVASPTQVIIAAQLVYENGEPFPLAEWEYKKYTLYSLKNLLANEILQYLYKKTVTDTKTTFVKITPDDIDFKTASQYGEADPDDIGNYYVYAVLAEEAEEYTWTLGNEADSPVFSIAQVNKYIHDRVNRVMIWNNGLTYYYFEIRHLADIGLPGYYGVVRNHLYYASLTSLTGLGTPVYDPDNEVIYPEKPEYDESIVSAEVKILQWRLVRQDYELKWQ